MIGSTQEDDERLLREMRQRNGATVNQLIQAAGVTRTAVRQKLSRLMGQRLVERREVRQARGRPFFEYVLTERAERLFGSNYPDLAVSLWHEIRGIKEPTTRRELVRRVRDNLVAKYGERVKGDTPGKRLEELREVLHEQGIHVEVDRRGEIPVLREHDCPYSTLAAADRSICALEKQVFARLLGCGVKLTRCRMVEDDSSCCEFEIREQRASV